MNNILFGIAETFKTLPLSIDKMFCDGYDMQGLLFWYEGLQKMNEEVKKGTKTI